MGLTESESTLFKVNVGDFVKESASRKKLTNLDLQNITSAFIGIELFDSDIGTHLKSLSLNGAIIADVPLSKERKYDLNYINIPPEKFGNIKNTNEIKILGGRGDAFKLRNTTIYVQLKNGDWISSNTNKQVYCTQKGWIKREGIVMNPIIYKVNF